jgi:hypothetical protein
MVFANAGISGRTPTGSTDEAIFENVTHTNLNGAFFTVNSAAPLLNDNGSSIFNGSVHNYLGQPGRYLHASHHANQTCSSNQTGEDDFAREGYWNERGLGTRFFLLNLSEPSAEGPDFPKSFGLLASPTGFEPVLPP